MRFFPVYGTVFSFFLPNPKAHVVSCITYTADGMLLNAKSLFFLLKNLGVDVKQPL